MPRNLLLPSLAGVAILFTSYHLLRAHQPVEVAEPLASPPKKPFASAIAAAGLVEARQENIAVGSVVPGVVKKIDVRAGDRAVKGQPLFELDDREVLADLRVREAQHALAKEDLLRLEALPRPEDVPPSDARVRAAQANLAAQEDLFRRSEKLHSRKAIGEEEFIQRRQLYFVAKEQLAEAEAQNAVLRAGAWERDKARARAEVARTAALVEQARTELDRLVIKAPIDGEILKVDVRPGEYVGAPPGQPLVVIGDLSRFHVRVDIDEQEIPRFRAGQSGKAFRRGETKQPIDLTFVRVEPYVMPKTSLTGGASERTDTRVLRVIYALGKDSAPVYVGQQLDVFLSVGAETQATAALADADPALSPR